MDTDSNVVKAWGEEGSAQGRVGKVGGIGNICNSVNILKRIYKIRKEKIHRKIKYPQA